MSIRPGADPGETTRSSTPSPARPLRTNSDFQLYWIGQAVATIGSRASSIAYPLLTLAITGSPTFAGVVGAAQTMPLVMFVLPAGVLADRQNRKRIMLVCEAVRAVALSSLVVAYIAGEVTVPQLVAVAFVEGTGLAFFKVAQAAALPHLVARKQLATAVALEQARGEGAELVGQPIGGALFGVSRVLPFGADALAHVISFSTLLFIRPTLQTQTRRSDARLVADIAEGFRWLACQPFLRTVTLLAGLTNAVFAAVPLIMIVRAQQFGARPWLIGMMFAFFGVFAIAGSLVASAAQRRLAPRTVVIGTLWVWTLGIGLLAVSPNAVMLGALGGLMMLPVPAFNVVVSVFRYTLTPAEQAARQQATARLAADGALPLGPLAAGLLTSALGPPGALIALSIVLGCTATATWATRSVRHPPELNQMGDEDHERQHQHSG